MRAGKVCIPVSSTATWLFKWQQLSKLSSCLSAPAGRVSVLEMCCVLQGLERSQLKLSCFGVEILSSCVMFCFPLAAFSSQLELVTLPTVCCLYTRSWVLLNWFLQLIRLTFGFGLGLLLHRDDYVVLINSRHVTISILPMKLIPHKWTFFCSHTHHCRAAKTRNVPVKRNETMAETII